MRVKFRDPVLGLYSRRMGAQINYWLSVLGYNVRDRSFTNRMYLVYFCLFWGLWILVMFFLIGYTLNNALRAMNLIGLLLQSNIFLAYLLMGWTTFQLWVVSQRSPFVFSEEDAYLLCQTPINHRTVGLVTFFKSWISTFLLFAGSIAVLTFTRVESRLEAGPSIGFIGQYLGGSVRALGILLPLQMGLQAALWGLGALRLAPPRDRQKIRQLWLRGGVFLLAFFLIGSFFLPNLRSFLFFPLNIPIQAAIGGGEVAHFWMPGLGVGLLFLVAGLFVLTALVKNISLNQAARETRLSSAIQAARSLGSFDLAKALGQRERLREPPAFTHLPLGKGSMALVWKDAVQSLRSIDLGLIFQWGLLFLWSVVMAAKVGWVAQIASAGAWVIQVGALTTRRARQDLSHWWLFHSLPINILEKINVEIVLPVIGVTLLGWLGVGLSGRPIFATLAAAILLPLMAVIAALSSLRDIFRHVETRLLLTPSIAEENVPRPSTEGILLLLLSTLAPFVLLLWQFEQPAFPLAALAGILLAGVIAYLLMYSIRRAYRWIE